MADSKLPREVIGKYKLNALLGRGGMGEVYEAYDADLDRTVALKTIRAENEGPQTLERFRREARAAGRLKHPVIVTVYDLGEAEGTVYIAMEYLEGRSLTSALQEGGLSLEDKLGILIQVLDGLEYAHSQKVVHRDIKPANVQVLPDGSVKILDFGIARILGADPMTRTGMIVGTPHYMSPEQLRGDPSDHRADIYSTGVLAYEMLTDRRPFEGTSVTEVILKVLNASPEPMGGDWRESMPDLERIVQRAMEKDPARRYASAGEMAADLRRAVGARVTAPPSQKVEAPPRETTHFPSRRALPVSPRALPPRAPAQARSRKPARLALAGTCVVAAGLGGALLVVWGRPPAATDSPSPAAPDRPARATPDRAAPAVADSSPPAAPARAIATPSNTAPAVARGVCVEAGPGGGVAGADLAGRVREALRARGAPLVARCAGAALAVRVQATVALRPAPFGGSALTADYSGVLELQRHGEAIPRRFDFDGRVMEFGEPAARAAALRQLADRVAESIPLSER